MNPEKFTTLLDMLAVRAKVSADKPAFTISGQVVHFAELWQGINRFAASLVLNEIERGERVVASGVAKQRRVFLCLLRDPASGRDRCASLPGCGY